MANFWFLLLIGFISCGLSQPIPPPDYSVKCTDHAYWVIVPLDSSAVSAALPDGVILDQIPPPFDQQVPSGKHPVIFELGHQGDCFWKEIPIFELSFQELKYEIPWVKSTISPLMFKPIIYMDSTVNADASYLVYGLPSVVAQNMSSSFNISDMIYNTVSDSGPMFKSNFSTDYVLGTANNSRQFPAFKAINDYKWLCYPPPLFSEDCAGDTYDWDNMKIRSVKSTISFDEGFFPGLPAQNFDFIDYPVGLIGASEVIVDLYITSPETC
jgi:hypothetical protein